MEQKTKFDELLKLLQGLKITQKSIDWIDNLPQSIYEDCFQNNYTELKFGLDVDTHRWYETSISVIKIYDRFLGIRHISNLFSENSDCEDIYFKLEFFEMKEVTEITYKKV